MVRPLPLILASSLLATATAVAAPPKVEALKVGDVAPNFTLKTMNPKRAKTRLFSLRNFVGDRATDPKIVVLSFAASYCVPCKKELAELKPLAEAFAKANVELAVVVIDTEPEGIEMMRKLTIDELDLPYPVLADRFGVLARRYEAEQLPKTVVIRPDGKVKWIATGFKKGAVEALRAQVGL